MILWQLSWGRVLFFETENEINSTRFFFFFFEFPQKSDVCWVKRTASSFNFVILSLEKWFYREIPNSVRQLFHTQFVNITECSACSIAFVFWQLKIETRLKDIFLFKRNIIRNAAGDGSVDRLFKEVGRKSFVEAKYICQLERQCKY